MKTVRCVTISAWLGLAAVSSLGAQISLAEYAARRDSLAARIGDGVVVGFGGRTPITDFGPFYQLPAFHYLTNFDEPDAPFVIVDQLRARKSPAEVALLKRAAEISSEGHRAAMLAPEPAHEYEIQAALEYTFTRLGGSRPAYGSIVGAGANGTQLHYMKDRAP